MRCLLICLLSSALAFPASAQIYKYTDANGNTAYSNQPPDGAKAKPVELPPLNSVGPSTPRNEPPPAPPAEQPASAGQSTAYPVLELADLPTDEALRANNGTFTVGVQIQPRLQPGHRLQLLLDGTPYGTPSNVPRLQLVNVDRGEHSLAVQVLDGDAVVQQSQTVTLTVQRVHAGRP